MALSLESMKQERDKMPVTILVSKDWSCGNKQTYWWETWVKLKSTLVTMKQCMIGSWRPVRQEKESLKTISTLKPPKTTRLTSSSKRTGGSQLSRLLVPRSQLAHYCLVTYSSWSLEQSLKNRRTASLSSHSFMHKLTFKSSRGNPVSKDASTVMISMWEFWRQTGSTSLLLSTRWGI